MRRRKSGFFFFFLYPSVLLPVFLSSMSSPINKDDERERESGKEKREERDLLGGFDDGVGRHDHEDTIGEDGNDDEEGEERVDEHVDGHPSDGVEGRQEPHGVRGTESVNVLPFADHHERLLIKLHTHTHTLCSSSSSSS